MRVVYLLFDNFAGAVRGDENCLFLESFLSLFLFLYKLSAILDFGY